MLSAAVLALATLAPASQGKPLGVIPEARVDWRPDALELSEEGDSFGFRLARSRPIPVVQVWIEGEGPFRFFLDTGAALTVLDLTLARSLELELGPEVPVGDPSDAPRVSSREIALKDLRVGATLLRDVPAVAMDRRRFGGVEGVRGVLGLPLFSTCLFTLDYPNKRVRLEHARLPEADGREVLAYGLSAGLPLLELEVLGRRIDLRIDSGAPSGITLPRAFAEDLEWMHPPRVRGLGRTVNNEFEIWQGVLDGDAQLGAHVFERPLVNLNDQVPTAFLGYRVLQDFELSVDQRDRRLRLRKPPRAAVR